MTLFVEIVRNPEIAWALALVACVRYVCRAIGAILAGRPGSETSRDGESHAATKEEP
jgi:hypothetical protein